MGPKPKKGKAADLKETMSYKVQGKPVGPSAHPSHPEPYRGLLNQGEADKQINRQKISLSGKDETQPSSRRVMDLGQGSLEVLGLGVCFLGFDMEG